MGIPDHTMYAKTKKHKFVERGIVYAEVHDFLRHELEPNENEIFDPKLSAKIFDRVLRSSLLYSGAKIKFNSSPMRTDIIVLTAWPKKILGQKGKRIRKLTSAITAHMRKRF